jgi:hypothetical protein
VRDLPVVATTADGAPGRSENEQDGAYDDGDDAESPEKRNVEYHGEDE